MARKQRPYEHSPRDGRELTLDDVGRELNLTRERVRQIEAAALRKVRSALERRGINQAVWHDYLSDMGRRSKTHYTGGPTFFFLGTGETHDAVVEEAENTISCGSEEPA